MFTKYFDYLISICFDMISVDFYRLGKSQSMILTNINLPSALGATQLKICILQHKMYFYCICRILF